MITIAAYVFSGTVSLIKLPAIVVNKKLNAVVVTPVAITPNLRHIVTYTTAAKNMMTPERTDRLVTHAGSLVTSGADFDTAKYVKQATPTAADRMTLVSRTVTGILVDMTCDRATEAEYAAGTSRLPHIL